MAYMQKKWVSHDKRFIVVDKYHSVRAMPKNESARERRRPKKQITSEQQEKINLRHRTERFQRLIMDNFKEGDWWVAFTLAEKVSVAEFKKAYGKMIRSLRKFYEEHGMDIKYIAVQENLEGRGRLHGHILLPSIPGVDFGKMKRALSNAWALGNTYFKPYEAQTMDARKVAAYMTKEETLINTLNEKMQVKRAGGNTKALDAELKAKRSRICTSLNLVRTKEVKTLVPRGSFRKEIKAPKGYHTVWPLSYNGNTDDNFDYQHAVFERDDDYPQNPQGRSNL